MVNEVQTRIFLALSLYPSNNFGFIAVLLTNYWVKVNNKTLTKPEMLLGWNQVAFQVLSWFYY